MKTFEWRILTLLNESMRRGRRSLNRRTGPNRRTVSKESLERVNWFTCVDVNRVCDYEIKKANKTGAQVLKGPN